jgi:hypothetical protein
VVRWGLRLVRVDVIICVTSTFRDVEERVLNLEVGV